MVHHYNGYDFSIAESGYGYSAGIGVALKFSDTVGFNLFEISYVGLPGSFTHAKKINDAAESSSILIQSGFILKIRKRK